MKRIIFLFLIFFNTQVFANTSESRMELVHDYESWHSFASVVAGSEATYGEVDGVKHIGAYALDSGKPALLSHGVLINILSKDEEIGIRSIVIQGLAGLDWDSRIVTYDPKKGLLIEVFVAHSNDEGQVWDCLLYTSPSPRDNR